MKGVQCYELLGGISHKNHVFLLFLFIDHQLTFSSRKVQLLKSEDKRTALVAGM